ncbi:MAG TPA: tripartite tricarboxylate transporter substrate-binding protein [Burkholderiales bacterium]|nr:tripartite tricarboxylate transporter substrate-binding protein [Burkholderiales bacterium]
MSIRTFAFVLGALLAGSAMAQDGYPAKPITLVMPYAVGGGADLMARALADSMRRTLGQPVTVANIVGAGSTIGSRQVAQSAPDGYTLLMNHIGLSTAPALFKNLQFDPVKGLEPIGLFSEIPMLVVAGKGFPPNNARELADYLRKHQDKVTVASSGMGSGTHLCAMLLEKAVGAKVTMVQYKGSAPAYQDIITGRVDLMCDSTGGSVAQVKGGNVKAFVVTGSKRLTSLPDIPTPSEVGLNELSLMTVWYALWAPAGTPKPIIDRLSGALQAAIRDPAIQSQLASWDAAPFDPKFAVPSALAEKMASNVQMWGDLIRKAGIAPQ